MPRIRRWHPVSHDFVRDREVQELRRQFAHWMTDVWLEMLSEADRNNGYIRGDYESLSRGLAWVSLSDRPSTQVSKIANALRWMEGKGWIKPGTGCVHVCNYAEYHKTRELNKSRVGTQQVPSVLTVLTELTELPKKKEESPAVCGSNGLPDWFKEVLKQSPHFSAMLQVRYAPFWTELGKTFDPYEWLAWDEQIHKADAWITANPQRKPRNLRRFVLNWFNKAVDMGRIQRAKEETVNRR